MSVSNVTGSSLASGVMPQEKLPAVSSSEKAQQPTNPVDTASFSEEAMDRTRQTAFDAAHDGKVDKLHFGEDGVRVAVETFTATTAQGSTVSVTRTPSRNEAGERINAYSVQLTKENGETLNIAFSGNLGITEGEDGSTSMYFAATNTTCTWNADGSTTESVGNLLDHGAGAVLVNTAGGEMRSGAGDDIVFMFADEAHISTGGGNDTIYFAELSQNNTIDAGHGNNTVYMKGRNQTVNLGDGDNTIRAMGMNGGSVTTGDGNNTVIFENNSSLWNGATISLGHGDNVVRVHEVRAQSQLNMGNGNNTLDVYDVHDASVSLGDGNNTVQGHTLGENGRLSAGDGNNSLAFYSIHSTGEFYAGDGANLIQVAVIEDRARVSVGNGNNDIVVEEIGDEAGFSTGDGNNVFQVARIDGKALLNFGTGDNYGVIGQAFGNNTLLLQGELLQNLGVLGNSGDSELFEPILSRRAERQENDLPFSPVGAGFNFEVNTRNASDGRLRATDGIAAVQHRASAGEVDRVVDLRV